MNDNIKTIKVIFAKIEFLSNPTSKAFLALRITEFVF